MKSCEEFNDERDTVRRVLIRQAGDESGFSIQSFNVGFNSAICGHFQTLK